MKLRILLLSTLFVLCAGCGPDGGYSAPTHPMRLPSGATVQLTACNFVWGSDHDARHPEFDSYALEYVSALPLTDTDKLDREALEVFGLIRPLSEQWGLPTATVAAFPQAERTGPYVMYVFTRAANGAWSFKREARKVFNMPSGRSLW